MKDGNFQERIKSISVALTLVLTVVGVGLSLFNYLVLNKLQPVYSSVTEVKAASTKLETELTAYKLLQDQKLDRLATKEQVTDLKADFNRMEGKIDSFILERSKP